MFVDDLSVETFPGQTNLMIGKNVGNATVKAGSVLKEGTRVQVQNWQDHDEAGYFSCILLEDSKPYKMGDEIDLDKWELNFKQ